MPKIAKTQRQKDYMSRNSMPLHYGAAGVDAWQTVNNEWGAYQDSLRHISRTPEELLMLAVLEDAIYLVRFPKFEPGGLEKEACREARQWFASPLLECCFDFLVICEHFNFSPANIRLKLHSAKAKRGRAPTRHHLVPGNPQIAHVA